MVINPTTKKIRQHLAYARHELRGTPLSILARRAILGHDQGHPEVAVHGDRIVPHLQRPPLIRSRYVVFDAVIFRQAPFGFILGVVLEGWQAAPLLDPVAELLKRQWAVNSQMFHESYVIDQVYPESVPIGGPVDLLGASVKPRSGSILSSGFRGPNGIFGADQTRL
jgi:hypothetical protein